MSKTHGSIGLNLLFRWPGICLVIWATACTERSGEQFVEIPARFEANRVFVDVAVHGGDTLRLYTDTGGGLFIYGNAADRINWQDSAGVILGSLAIDKDFPEPLGTSDHRIPIFRNSEDGNREYDGMLGQAWFANRIWTFDYPSQKLLIHPVAPLLEPEIQTLQLGFLTDSTGARLLSFPRISVLVDGDTLDMLFDTGATVHPGAETLQYLGIASPVARATSFITSEVLNRWRVRHPDWRLIQNADERVSGMRMILVPEVLFGDLIVGPVWFTERPDANFHNYMSQWMDRRVDGALGGNVFGFFKITLDYPAAVAHFVRANGSG